MAYRIVMAQLAAALAATLALSVVSMRQAMAAALGGLVCILPTAGFAVCASALRRPGPILFAGALKPLVVIGLMVVAFILAKPAPLGFFVALAAVHLAYLAVPLLDGERAAKPAT